MGYKIYYRTSSSGYGSPIDVGNVLTYTIPGLTEGLTYHFALTAYDTSLNESVRSAEVAKSIDSPPGGGSSPPGGSASSGGGCGRIKNIFGGPGQSSGQHVMNLFILALPLIVVKLRWLLGRKKVLSGLFVQ